MVHELSGVMAMKVHQKKAFIRGQWIALINPLGKEWVPGLLFPVIYTAPLPSGQGQKRTRNRLLGRNYDGSASVGPLNGHGGTGRKLRQLISIGPCRAYLSVGVFYSGA